MSKQILDAGPNPEIIVDEANGDLQVRGWETPQVAIQAEPEELTLEHQDDRVQMSCTGDLELHLPLGTLLTLGSIHGDASLKFLEDGLTAGEIHGDLNLRQVAGCRAQTLHGDLTAKHISDNLEFALVNGDADARHVRGDCIFDEVKGNLDLQDVSGSIRAHSHGTARLRLHELSGEEYQVRAEGNLYCYLPEDAGLNVKMHSEGHAIKVRLPEGSTTYPQPDHELVLGDGDVEIFLSSGGSLYLFVERPGWTDSGAGAGFSRPENFGLPEDFGQQIAQQVESQIQSQMADVTRRINEQMAHLSDRLGRAGFSPEETERIVEQARRTGDNATDRAQEKMRRAQEKLERKLEAHRRRSEGRVQAATDRRTRRQSWGFEWPAAPTPPAPPAPPRPQATEEERLLILRMLEQKKISLEEADRLLSALEGNT